MTDSEDRNILSKEYVNIDIVFHIGPEGLTLDFSIKPVNYQISLHDLELSGAFSYRGLVKIELDIKATTKDIVLNAHKLQFQHVKLSAQGVETQKASNISYDETSQRAALSFPNEISPSENAVLDIEFTGTINNNMAGFYRSKYQSAVEPAKSVPKEDDSHYMFSTQFESCDARQAFPCFDEPNLKATFDLNIEIPDDLVALSNTPERESKKTEDGMKVVSFERSPIMSTYLLAWAVGDLEYVEEFTQRKYNGNPIPVRVYTTRGLKDQARFGLKNAYQIVDYFSEVFLTQSDHPRHD
ncbi:MAG: hypothetical protein Q9220_002997 [cf. Caloplaca sp. 1 TL-2023]